MHNFVLMASSKCVPKQSSKRYEIRNHDVCVNDKLKNVLTTSGLAEIKASCKEIVNSPNYKKATAAHQRLFLLFKGILGFSVPSIILAGLPRK